MNIAVILIFRIMIDILCCDTFQITTCKHRYFLDSEGRQGCGWKWVYWEYKVNIDWLVIFESLKACQCIINCEFA